MKKYLLLIVTVLLLAATACKQGNTEPEYSGCGAVNTPNFERYELKSGIEVRSIFIALGVNTHNVTKIKASQQPPANSISADRIKYIDGREKDILCWLDEDNKTIFYYADGVTTANATKKIILPPNSSSMFSGFDYVTEIDTSVFNTSKVENMQSMFSSCDNLTILDVSHFDTSNVTNMGGMFCDCHMIETLDVSNFDTSKVTNMALMFAVCRNLVNLDVSNFDTSNVENMNYMFGACNKVTTLDVSGFNTAKVTDMSLLFWACECITNLDVSNFDTSKVQNMQYMFKDCTNLTTLDLSSFDTSKVTTTYIMFQNCINLQTIYVSDSFVTTSIIENGNYAGSYQMFFNCPKLKGGNGTEYDSNHIDKEYARIDTEGTPGYFTRKPTNP